MFLRMVTHTYRDKEILHMAETYERLILSALHETKGCLFAALIQNIYSIRECVSLTLWNSFKEAAAYEAGGLYLQLVDALRPYFSDSVEWKLQLNEDNSLENVAVQIDPAVEGFTDSVTSADDLRRLKAKPFAVQIVTLNVQDGHGRDFEQIFASEILPKYRGTKGFIDLILLRQNREYHSISFWDETVDVASPANMDSVNQLVRSIYSVLPSFVQWKLSQHGASHTSASSEDMKAAVYRVLTAEWFTEHESQSI